MPLVNIRLGATWVDDCDVGLVQAHAWCVITHKESGKQYVSRRTETGSSLLHRELLVCAGEVDHRNGDGLDNRRGNLREATRSQNMHSRGKTKANTSGVKGVQYDRQTGRWMACIRVDGKRHRKRFDLLQEAAQWVQNVRADKLGEFAWH